MSSHLMHSMYDSTVFNSLAGFAAGPFVTIFSLHRPLSSDHPHAGTDPTFLRSALEVLLKKGFTFLSLSDIVDSVNTDRPIPSKAVCFTVDDGYSDQARDLLPVLNEANAKATMFVITDFLDAKEWPWDEKITYILQNTRLSVLKGLDAFFPCELMRVQTSQEKRAARRILQTKGKDLPAKRIPAFIDWLATRCKVDVPEQPPFGYQPMTWEQARQLEAEGTRFAPHSCNHYITNKVSTEEARRQFSQSWNRLRKELRNPAKIYCYPTGRLQDFDRIHERILLQEGYRGAVSFVSKPLRLRQFDEQRFRLPRIAFPDTMAKVLRYASWYEAIRSFR